MRRTLLRHAGWIYCCDDDRRVIERGWLLVEGGRIAAIGAEPCPIAETDEAVDLAGCLVTHGLINLHHHFFQSLTRAVAGLHKSTVLDWLAALYPVWLGLDAEAAARATRVACAELLLSGGTTSVDHAYLVPDGDDDILEAEIAAAAAMGVRLHLVVGGAPTLEGDLEDMLRRRLGAAVERLVQKPDAILAQMRRFARRHDGGEGAGLVIALGSAGVTYAIPELMRAIADVAGAHGCALHTHLHPRRDEREKAAHYLGCGPVDFLADAGWLRPGTWFAHCSQLTDAEMDAFAANGVGVAHCPRTIPRLGFPLTRIGAMRRHGVRVGLGVDGSASNDSGSILADLRLAAVLHRIGTPSNADRTVEWMDPQEALDLATRDAAAVLGRRDIGSLAPGMQADIAAFDLRRAAYAGCLTDPLGGWLMAGCDPYAALTMVAGTIRVRHGRLVAADEGEIKLGADAAARRMLEQAGWPT